MSNWKYGTILRDDRGGRFMVVSCVSEDKAGEADLYEAITLDEGNWITVSPRDGDLTEIMDPNDPNVIVFDAAANNVTGGPTHVSKAGDDTVRVQWNADGTFSVSSSFDEP